MPTVRAGGNLFGKARVSLLQPRRPRQEKLSLLDPRTFRQLRLVESSEEVNQRETEDAQRGRDGDPVEEPTQLRVWMVVEAVVKRCHPSVIREMCGAISKVSVHISSYVAEATPTIPGQVEPLPSSNFMLRDRSAPNTSGQNFQ